jgi:hypothetical protein
MSFAFANEIGAFEIRGQADDVEVSWRHLDFLFSEV